MNGSRKSVIREAAIVAMVAVVLFSIGGYLIHNVVVGIRSLNTEKLDIDADSVSVSLEKAVHDIVDKVTLFAQSFSQPNPPGTAVPAAADRKAEVKQVRFFETGKVIPVPKDRKYSERFSEQARYIYTEVTYKNNNYKVQDTEIPITAQYLDAAGKVIAEKKGVARPKKEWAGALYIMSAGQEQPGKWVKGQYSVKIFIDEEFIGDYTFSVE